MLLPYFAPSHPRLYTLYMTISMLLIYLAYPSPPWNGRHFLEKSCPAIMSLYRTTFEAGYFRMSFYRTTCENAHRQMSFYRATCEQGNVFPKMSSIASRRGVHKVYKEMKNIYKESIYNGFIKVRKG